MPGNRPARNTPGGNGFSLFGSALLESMLDESVAPVTAEDVDFEVEVAEVEVDVDEELDESFLVSLRELAPMIIEQNGSCPAGVRQS